MLVLQREVGEQIRIGDDIVVTVVRTACGRVSLGIQAPTECRIRRAENVSRLAATATATTCIGSAV